MLLSILNIFTLITVSSLGVAEDYSINANSLGIGNTWISGDVTPLHISVSSNVHEATAAWIQWEVPDADGDTVFWGKPITLTPSGTTSAWLYAPLQPWADSSTTWIIRLRGWNGTEPTEELATIRFSPNSIGAINVDSSKGLIAVYGTRRLGLSRYQPYQPHDVKHEATIIVSGLTNKDLPDAWPCLDSLDALVWADTTPQFTLRQETALRQWVKRGGHLIISLPTIGNPWNIGSENGPLSSLLYGIDARVEHIELGYLDQVLGRNRGWPRIDVTLRTFQLPENQNETEFLYPILTLRNQKIVGVQRAIGTGAVSVIGVDVSSGQLAALNLPETDVFWNRVLGRRNDTPSQSSISLLQVDSQLSLAVPTTTVLPLGNLVAQEIAMSTTAGGRLGTAFLLITVYWVVSGPALYFILRHKKKQRWSWVAFTGCASIFAVVSWGIASTTTNVQSPLRHVTIIDHVYGVDGQRAIGWCSLFLPTFGSSDIVLGGTEQNLLLPWISPDSSGIPPFVDHREIIVNLDRVPNSFDQPSRATTANFSYNWLGGIDHPFYKSIIRVSPENKPDWVQRTGKLRGSIVNHMTKTLHDVSVVLITPKRNPVSAYGQYQDNTIAPWIQRTKSGQPLNVAFSWRVPSWESGDTIDFSQFEPSPEAGFAIAVKNRYQQNEENRFFRNSTVISKSAWRTKMEMLSLYSHLQPPVYQKRADSKRSPSTHQTIRHHGHNIDFAEWFSRPCIIVMGFIHNAPIPVPISVDGNRITQSTGETFVRWVYPLGDFP